MKQAENTRKASNFKFLNVDFGSHVMVPVPDVDRARCEFRNIGVVKNVNDGAYTIDTKHGILNCKYVRNQITPSKRSNISADELPAKNIYLREVARTESIGSGQGYSICNCLQGCPSIRCNCLKSKILCNSKCHIVGTATTNRNRNASTHVFIFIVLLYIF